ncbi:MAG: hypothetical protein QT03_C0001G1316 [archaeon GW2011_AR10]|nr:MAG: hypothetical protein QT03_C0001G1316 [archaeon GW2011_AR10]
MKQENNLAFQIIFFLSVLLIIVSLFLFLSDKPQFFSEMVDEYGLLGLFIGAIIGTSTILLPLPIDVVIALVGAEPSIVGLEGSLPNLIVIGLIAGLGAAIGEMTSYLLGLMGMKAIEKNFESVILKKIDETRERLNKSGIFFIFIASATPIPFDLVGIVAGLIKYSPTKFFIGALIGKVFRYVLLAFAGFYGIGAIKGIFFLP